MSPGWEVAANATIALSIFLAGKNSVHTWWTGIVGCVLFGFVFWHARLYADVTLQGFFVVSSGWGWWHWLRGWRGGASPVRRSRPAAIALGAALALGGTAGYGAWLSARTDAFAPYLDSAILAFSVLGQLSLVRRRYETWWCWLIVNTVAVPLYAVRGLHVTAALYAAFWVNAVVALCRWRRFA